jgi:hypothetical protein
MYLRLLCLFFAFFFFFNPIFLLIPILNFSLLAERIMPKTISEFGSQSSGLLKGTVNYAFSPHRKV